MITRPETDRSQPFQKAPGDMSVAVVMATYNGATRVREQLDSYLIQTHMPALILVSDDGSSDGTEAIVRGFAAEHPELPVEFLSGPRKGAAQNFLSLLRRVPDHIDAVALSDQDDVWLPDKIQRGLCAIADVRNPQSAILYCGRSWECDENLRKRSLSRGLRRPAGFRHALVQNLAGGNTMMLNHAALELVQNASHEARKVVVHDWWLYQILAGAGGQILFDDAPLLLYRQHSRNLIGANRGLQAKIKRGRLLLSGRFRYWNTVNISALNASAHRLTPQNRQILRVFAEARNGSLLQRLLMLRQTGVYRQGLQGSLSLYLAALLRRL